MKFVILVFAVACAQARPQGQDVPIIKSSFDIDNEGSYKYEYETGDGIYVQAEGGLRQSAQSEYPSLETKGSYRYTSPEGEPVEISYIANEDGYQPQGSHIPQAPPVPEYITRALQYIESHPPLPASNFPGRI